MEVGKLQHTQQALRFYTKAVRDIVTILCKTDNWGGGGSTVFNSDMEHYSHLVRNASEIKSVWISHLGTLQNESLNWSRKEETRLQLEQQ